MISDSIVTDLTLLANDNPTVEVCGVIDSEGTIYPIDNVSKTPHSCFEFNKLQYVKLLCKLAKEEKKIFCIYHTHPSGDTTPSKADVEFAKRTNHPLLIVTKFTTRWVD